MSLNFFASGKIEKITSFRSLEKIKSYNLKNTLVIFDVDYTLIMPHENYSLTRHPCRKALWKDFTKNLTQEEIRIYYSITKVNAKWELMDPYCVELFDYLKQNNISTVALTAIGTGSFGIIPKMEDMRIEKLEDFGFDFKNTFTCKKTIILKELKNEYGIPMLKEGVIFTAEQDKGAILEHILRQCFYNPSKIVFVDDKLENLISVEKLCKKQKIQFHGFLYTISIPLGSLNKEEEKLRFNILRDKKIWIVGPLLNNAHI